MNISHKNYPHVSNYVNAWKKLIEMAKEDPNQKVLLFRYDGETTVIEALNQFRKALNNRINFRGNIDVPKGKKDCTDYFWQQKRDQKKLQDKIFSRVIIHQFETKEVKNRFSYLLSDYKEDY